MAFQSPPLDELQLHRGVCAAGGALPGAQAHGWDGEQEGQQQQLLERPSQQVTWSWGCWSFGAAAAGRWERGQRGVRACRVCTVRACVRALARIVSTHLLLHAGTMPPPSGAMIEGDLEDMLAPKGGGGGVKLCALKHGQRTSYACMQRLFTRGAGPSSRTARPMQACHTRCVRISWPTRVHTRSNARSVPTRRLRTHHTHPPTSRPWPGRGWAQAQHSPIPPRAHG